MKITERQLRHIIRESLESAINEVTSTGTFNMGDYFFDYESEDTIPDFVYMVAERLENHLNRAAGIKDGFNVDVTLFNRLETGDADIHIEVGFDNAVKKGANPKEMCRIAYFVSKHTFKNIYDIKIMPKYNLAELYLRYRMDDPIFKKNPRTMSTDYLDVDDWRERGKRIKKHPIEMDDEDTIGMMYEGQGNYNNPDMELTRKVEAQGKEYFKNARWSGTVWAGWTDIRVDGKTNFINKEGRILSPDQWFDRVGHFGRGREDFAKVWLNGRENLLNMNGKKISEMWYDRIDTPHNGCAAVKLKGKGWNFLNLQGKYVSGDWFDEVRPFEQGYARVRLSDRGWNFLNKQGNYVSREWFDILYPFNHGYSIVRKRDKGYNVIDTNGELQCPWVDKIIAVSNGEILAVDNGENISFPLSSEGQTGHETHEDNATERKTPENKTKDGGIAKYFGFNLFAVNKKTGKIAHGWRSREQYNKGELSDMGLNPRDYDCQSFQACQKRGIDPNDDSSWETPPMTKADLNAFEQDKELWDYAADDYDYDNEYRYHVNESILNRIVDSSIRKVLKE